MAEVKKKASEVKLNLFLNKRYKALNAIIGVLVLLIGYFFLLQPRWQSLSEAARSALPEKIAELKVLQEYGQEVAALEELVSGYQANYQQEIKVLEQVLPTAAQIPELIAQLDALVQKSGFKISELSVNEVVPAKSKKKQAAPAAAGENPAEAPAAAPLPEPETAPEPSNLSNLKTLNIVLGVVGGDYAAFKVLLAKIEKHIRLLDLLSIDFSVDESGVNEYSLNLRTYYFP